jgi:hypothetical protein
MSFSFLIVTNKKLNKKKKKPIENLVTLKEKSYFWINLKKEYKINKNWKLSNIILRIKLFTCLRNNNNDKHK